MTIQPTILPVPLGFLLASTAFAGTPTIEGEFTDFDLAQWGPAVAVETNAPGDALGWGANTVYLDRLHITSDADNVYIGVRCKLGYGMTPMLVTIAADVRGLDGHATPLPGVLLSGSTLDLPQVDFAWSLNAWDSSAKQAGASASLSAHEYTTGEDVYRDLGTDFQVLPGYGPNSVLASWTNSQGTGTVRWGMSGNDSVATAAGFEMAVPKSLLHLGPGQSRAAAFFVKLGIGGLHSRHVLPTAPDLAAFAPSDVNFTAPPYDTTRQATDYLILGDPVSDAWVFFGG